MTFHFLSCSSQLKFHYWYIHHCTIEISIPLNIVQQIWLKNKQTIVGAAKTNGPEEIKGWRTDKILIGPSTYQRPIFSNGSSRQAYGSPWTPRPGAPINCLDTLLPSSCSLGECWGPKMIREMPGVLAGGLHCWGCCSWTSPGGRPGYIGSADEQAHQFPTGKQEDVSNKFFRA